MKSYKEQFREIIRGTKEIIDLENLEKKLFYSEKNDFPLRVKLGADPTSSSLHIGHMVPVHKLKQFQDFGHNAFFLIGDFTARIGDPTGRSSKRNVLSKEEVTFFSKNYLNQIFNVLDPSKTEVLYNSKWFENINIYDFINNLASKYTVAKMLTRDDFSTRYNLNKPIALSEFLYPLMQAYDSVILKADVELGGNDQLFNFMITRQIQSQFGQEPEIIITLPTIKGIDGKEKMSKSLKNAINISDTYNDMYGKIMSINDEVMLEYYSLLSSKSLDYINKIKNKEIHPKTAKEELAIEIVSLYHSQEKAEEAKNTFERQFVHKKIPKNLEETIIKSEGPLSILELIYMSGKSYSKNEIRRLIKQKGISVDNNLVKDPKEMYRTGTHIIRIGKKNYLKVRIKQ